MRPSEMVAEIKTRADFVRFVQALLADLKEHPERWENVRLEDYLEALGAWVEGMDGYYRNTGHPVPDQPTWKVLGDILMAASIYE